MNVRCTHAEFARITGLWEYRIFTHIAQTSDTVVGNYMKHIILCCMFFFTTFYIHGYMFVELRMNIKSTLNVCT